MKSQTGNHSLQLDNNPPPPPPPPPPRPTPPSPPPFFDPINLFPNVIEFFVPIGAGANITQFGFWVEATGLIKITIQQAIVPDDIFTQIKIITFQLPFPIAYAVFILGFGMFSIKSGIVLQRTVASQTTQTILRMLQSMIDRINNAGTP